MAASRKTKGTASHDLEKGAIRKRWPGRLRIALAYPNHYAVAMASLGFQTVYRLLNDMEHLVCERVFLPEDSAGKSVGVVSVESGRRLTEFDCIAFSISFENDYANCLTLIDLAGLPLPSAHRGASLPLVMAGGVACFLNPEPLAPFFDCFLLGEAEAVLPAFFERYDPRRDRRRGLTELARDVRGVYVPAFYRESYREDGTLASFTPVEDVPERVERVYAPDLKAFSTQTAIHSTQTSFDDVHLIEVSRGCPYGCRFCAAGFVYRSPRHRPLAQLLGDMQYGAGQSRKVGLLGTAVSNLPDLKQLCAAGKAGDVQLTFSSLRADALDDDLVASLKAGRLKTATVAPETGSERMRRVINKGLDEAAILAAAERLVAGGIPNIKLYFMVGLPTETDEDVTAIIALVKKIKHAFLQSSRARGRMGHITVSINSFVPKAFTPFQWEAMDDIPTLKQKLQQVKSGLKKVANVRVHADVPRWAHLQALFARGDRRVAQLLVQAHQNNGNWPQTFKSSIVNPSFYTMRRRCRDELLPWDFIDHGLDKAFLWNDYQRALEEKQTPTCPMAPSACNVCGVCRPDSPLTGEGCEC